MIRRVGEDAAGMRLDAFLAREDECFPALSRSAAAKLIAEGNVTKNGSLFIIYLRDKEIT